MSEEVASLFARLGLKINEAEWNRGDKAIENMKKAAGAVAGFFAVREVGEFIGATVEAGAHAQKMGEQLGISAESVSELSYVAKRSETDIETLSTALGHVAHSLTDELPKGTGPTLDALNKLGITTAQVKKIMSGPGGADDLLGMVSDKIAAMEPGLAKSGAASDIFGAKLGGKLVPFLDLTSDGIAKLRGEAHELGQTFTQDEAETMDTIEENWGRVKDGMAGVRNQVVTALAPALKAAGEWLVGAMKEAVGWVREHKDEIAAFGFAVGRTFMFVGRAIAGVFQFAYDMVTFVIDGVKLLIGALADAGGFMMDVIIRPAMRAAIAVWNFLRPIGEFIANVFRFARARAIEFVEGVISAGHRVVDFFVGIGDTIMKAFDRVIHYVRYELPEQLKSLPVIGQIAKLGEFIGTNAAKAYEAVHGEDNGADASDPYTIWSQSNNGSREDFERERSAAMQSRGLTAPNPNGGSATATGPTAYNGPVHNEIKVGDINITAPAGADAQTYASLVETHVKQTFQDLFDTHLTNAAASVGEVPA